MPSKIFTRFIGTFALAAAASTAQAQLPWSDDTHQIAFGDFNGDSKTDLLYVARSPGASSGIALSNNAGPYTSGQTWASNFLGIAWHSGTYEPIVADFNGDGKADIFLQRQGQGDHYLLHANAQGQIAAINQTLPFNHGGQIWSADGHRIVAGDFNGDAKADLFLQAVKSSDLNAVFLANSSGLFGSAQQTWGNSHIGFNWSLPDAVVHSGDFNGDGKADLFVQAKPDLVIIDYDVQFLIPAYRAGSFGVANAKTPNVNGEIFFTPALQIWDRNYFGADWSAANFNALVGDFDGDGRADIVLQSRVAGRTNSQFNASSSGQFNTGNVLTDATLLNASAETHRLYAANFDGTPGVGVYLQARASSGTSQIAYNSTTPAQTMINTYDALGRLTFVSDPSNGNRDFDYDRAGNRLLVSVGTANDAAAEPESGPTIIAITSSTGTILASASSLYNVSNTCESAQWHTACTWMVRKSYGDFSAVAVVVRAPDGAIPACTNGTIQQITSGYVRSECVLTVLSTVYGN